MKRTAFDTLKTIVNERNWHNGIIERRHASVLKRSILDDKISYEKAVEILGKLGYKKIQEEIWAK